MAELDLDRDGAQLHRAVLATTEIDALRALADDAVGARPGARLQAGGRLGGLLDADGAVGAIAAAALGATSRPVRAVMFDKSPASNWAVGCTRTARSPCASAPMSRASVPGRARTGCFTSLRQ